MEIEDLEETLLVIAYKAQDKDASIRAFNSLYHAYSKIMSAIVKKNLKNMNIYNEELYQATINNVFLKVYENPLLFEIPPKAKNDNCFKSWLSVVAKNEIFSLLKDFSSEEKRLTIESEETQTESAEIDEEISESLNSKTMKDALLSLSDRDREIMFTLYNYYEKGKKTPTDVLDEIARIHNTTKLNIRKIKERSEKKIIQFFTKHSELKPLDNGN